MQEPGGGTHGYTGDLLTFMLYLVGWSENGRKNFFLEFQLARNVQRCQYIKRTLCKKLKIFNNFFDLPSQLFILQHYATLER